MPPGEDPNKPKKRRDELAEEVKAPETDLEPTSPDAIEYDKLVGEAPSLVAKYADIVGQRLAGDWWDTPHSLIAFGTSSTAAVELIEKRPAGVPRAIAIGADLQEVVTSILMECVSQKRLLICVVSRGVYRGGAVPPPGDELGRSRRLAHRGAGFLAEDRINRLEYEDGRRNILSLVQHLAGENFRPECRGVSNTAPNPWTTRLVRPRSGSGPSWYSLNANDLIDRVRVGMEGLEEPDVEFLLQLTSLPKECEPWLVGEKSQAERLREALDEALAGVRMPAAEESLAEVSAPVDGVALARSVWQSLRAEMKEVIEVRIRELSQQRLETFEEKAAVAAELHQAMVDWGFRAIAPATGQASFLRCKQTKKNPLGFFSFESIADAPVVAPIEADPPKTPSVLPPFRLTDPPPDRRRK